MRTSKNSPPEGLIHITFTLYSKVNCVQCKATKKTLEGNFLREGIHYRTVCVDQDPAALEQLKELGFLQAPVVITETDAWSGFRPDKLADLVADLDAKAAEAEDADMRRLANGGHDVLTDGAP